MDRNALLLYLQNIRDLEITRLKIKNMYNNQYSQYDSEIKKRQTILNQIVMPTYDFMAFEYKSGGLFYWFCVISVIFLLVVFLATFIVANIPESSRIGDTTITFADCWKFLFPIPAFVVLALKFRPESKDKQQKQYNNQKAHYDKEWFKQVSRIKSAIEEHKAKIQQLQSQWSELDIKYRKDYSIVSDLLNYFYSMNILASQYRNCASAIYIYDYMSTSQASLNDTLIHEHMENGIHRLEAKLNQVVTRLDDIVYETRCIRDENRASIQRTIDQNNRMLKQLQMTTYNTQEAAQYAQLAANYSRANAYFAAANYLK